MQAVNDELPYIPLPIFLIAVVILLPVYVVRKVMNWKPAHEEELKLVPVCVGSEVRLSDPDWAVQSVSGMERARLAFVEQFGSRRMIHRMWVKVFCRFVNYWRGRRGDIVLPEGYGMELIVGYDPPDRSVHDGDPASSVGACLGLVPVNWVG